ncbi:hypothetical protein CALVIDRAFT_478155 [Calocera viscosa TUFC12733]|uniref:Methyltransferase domain-containing protein n=1 Tax=Calocera viscosa (strain TUFC12733) TaxID=1330018 RepID=A0A167PMN7_CALVF|nr:hypothetical protein CALVIDRAFT_478155 [Calocera viscosa TUFC12733]
MSDPKITYELPTPPIAAPLLDRSLWKPNGVELDFLHSAISEDDEVIKQRLFKVQEKSYQDYPYPCIRAFHFVSLMMRENSIYKDVLERGKAGDAYLLDLGCMMGTDLRNLVRDGYPGDKLIGCDLRDNYIKAGYELYEDATTCPIKFMTGDMFSIVPSPSTGTPGPLDLASVKELNDLHGQLSFIYTGALFHLFDESTQKAIALRLASLWKRVPGAVVFGRHQGRKVEGQIADHMGRLRYAHSPSSWERMWKEVLEQLEGDGAGDKIRVKAQLGDAPGGVPSDATMLYWSVERI